MTHPPRGGDDDTRIRELLPLNLFAVFSERDPERRLKAIVADYTEDVIWSSETTSPNPHEIVTPRVLNDAAVG